jgi:hypothetical protein
MKELPEEKKVTPPPPPSLYSQLIFNDDIRSSAVYCIIVQLYTAIHRLNMEVDLLSLYGLHVT